MYSRVCCETQQSSSPRTKEIEIDQLEIFAGIWGRHPELIVAGAAVVEGWHPLGAFSRGGFPGQAPRDHRLCRQPPLS